MTGISVEPRQLMRDTCASSLVRPSKINGSDEVVRPRGDSEAQQFAAKGAHLQMSPALPTALPGRGPGDVSLRQRHGNHPHGVHHAPCPAPALCPRESPPDTARRRRQSTTIAWGTPARAQKLSPLDLERPVAARVQQRVRPDPGPPAPARGRPRSTSDSDLPFRISGCEVESARQHHCFSMSSVSSSSTLASSVTTRCLPLCE